MHCAYCGTRILIGGKRDDDVRYCNDRCQGSGRAVQWSHQLPVTFVQEQIAETHQGKCPTCGGSGPIDVHTSYSVWSALYLTRWVSSPHLCCRSCGVKFCLKDTAFSLALGWWGVPFGLILTPVQVFRNVASMKWRSPDPAQPSALMERLVRTMLGRQVYTHHQQSGGT